MTDRPDPAPPPDEAEYLRAYDPGAFARPSVTVDAVLLTAFDGAMHALLVRRDQHPFRDRWALPGGFVGIDESLDDAARRVIREKAAVTRPLFQEQLYTFGAPGRDPRMRIITVAYYALAEAERLRAALSSTPTRQLAALAVPWPGEHGGPVNATAADGSPLPLAFDHAEILGLAVKRLRGKLTYAPIGFALLPERFTLRALQAVHETILGRPLNKDSFRRRMLASGELEATGDQEEEVLHRPAALYRHVEPG